MKILCLFVRHGTTAYPDSLAALDRWYQSQGLIEQRTLWIIDNSLPADAAPLKLETGAVLRRGDNLAWEFSAWAHALKEARAEGIDCDFVHCVTSAFNTLYTGYLEHFSPWMLEYVKERNVCLGHIDIYHTPIRVGPTRSQAWIRTCFFFLPFAVAKKFSPWATYQDPTVVFANPTTREFRADAPIDSGYQDKITTWLEGRMRGGHHWHSPIGDGASENARFQSKTLAILNEHSLAITLRLAEIRLADFCWLHAFQATPRHIISDPISEIDQENIRRNILGFQNDPDALTPFQFSNAPSS